MLAWRRWGARHPLKGDPRKRSSWCAVSYSGTDRASTRSPSFSGEYRNVSFLADSFTAAPKSAIAGRRRSCIQESYPKQDCLDVVVGSVDNKPNGGGQVCPQFYPATLIPVTNEVARRFPEGTGKKGQYQSDDSKCACSNSGDRACFPIKLLTYPDKETTYRAFINGALVIGVFIGGILLAGLAFRLGVVGSPFQMNTSISTPKGAAWKRPSIAAPTLFSQRVLARIPPITAHCRFAGRTSDNSIASSSAWVSIANSVTSALPQTLHLNGRP